MADLIDFNKFAQTAISLQNSQEMMRRNDLAEQHFQLQQQVAQQQEQHRQQASVFKAFDEVEKLANTPQFSGIDKQVDLRLAQANLIKNGLGIEVPVPTREEMLGATEEFAENIKAFRNNADPDVRRAALEKVILSAPNYGKGVLESLKAAGELDVQGEELLTKIELNRAKLGSLNLKSGRLKMNQTFLAGNLGAVNESVQLLDDPKFKTHVQKLSSFANDTQRDAYMNMNPEFKREWQATVQAQKDSIGILAPDLVEAFGADAKPRVVHAMEKEISMLMKAKNEVLQKTGSVPVEIGEEISRKELARNARSIQAEWLQDPFNKDKIQALKHAQTNLRIVHDSIGHQLTDVQDQRLALQRTKLDDAKQAKLANDYTQEKFLEFLQSGHDDNQAALLAIRSAKKAFPETPIDANSMKNFLKTGKQEVTVNVAEPTKKVVGDLQTSVLDTQKTMRVVDTLIDTIDQKNVGLSAALKSTAFGLAGQVKGLAEGLSTSIAQERKQNPEMFKGFTPSKWFDPSIPTVDLLANTLAYRLINLEQGGRISDKDLSEMKKRLNITSLLATKEDSLVRLKEVKKQLEFEDNVNRRIIGKFGQGGETSPVQGALESLGVKPAAPAKKPAAQALKPITEMSADEKLQELMQFQQQFKK